MSSSDSELKQIYKEQFKYRKNKVLFILNSWNLSVYGGLPFQESKTSKQMKPLMGEEFYMIEDVHAAKFICL